MDKKAAPEATKSASYKPAASSAVQNMSTSRVDLDGGSQTVDLAATSGQNEIGEDQLDGLLEAFTSRSAFVSQQLYKSTLQNLSVFMRLQVQLTVRSTSKAEAQLIQIPVLIERTKTIEHLARHIEAEYAFMRLKETIAHTDDPEVLINSLCVVLMYDISNVGLKFNSSLEEVVNNGDEVFVVSVLIENMTMNSLVQQKIQRFHNLLAVKPSAPIDTWNLESKTYALLHNVAGIQAFQEYCMGDFEIENLLFWLEVEVFRGLCFLANGNDFSSTHVDISDGRYGNMMLHARYIYFTFLAPTATLRLNLSDDMLQTVDWPLPKTDPLSGVNLPLRIGMWDYLQEHVFLYLSQYVYLKFEKSPSFAPWRAIITNKHNYYDTNEGWFFPGQHHQTFQQDIEGMEIAVATALVTNSHQLNYSTASHEGHHSIPNGGRTPKSARRNSQASAIRPSRRSSVMKLSDDVASSNLPPEFYGKGPKITNAQKLRRVQREKKLKKFFGDSSVTSENQPRLRPRLISEDTDASSESSDNFQPNESINAHVDDDRRRRADKLGEFFGTMLPEEQMFEQRLVDRLEMIEAKPELVPTPALNNELDPEVKAAVIRRRKKLQGLLGELAPIDDVMLVFNVNRVTSSSQSVKSPKGFRRSGSLSDDESDANSSSLVTATDRAKKAVDEKEYKRRKADKIQQFLGERINTSTLLGSARDSGKEGNLGSGVQPKDKQAYLRRINKLQGMFGDAPPTSIVTATDAKSVDSLSGQYTGLNDVLNNEPLLKFLITSDNHLTELLKVLEDFDREEGLPYPNEADEGDSGMPASVEGKFAKKISQARQRRRIGKLTRFFGSPAGPISTELSAEEMVLEDLGHHLLPLLDPSVVRAISSFKQPGTESETDIAEEAAT